MSGFQELKLEIVELLGLAKDAIHVHLGLAVFVAVALLLRGRRWPYAALLAAAVVAVGLEVLDLSDDIAGGGRPRWRASVHDIVNTLFWPVVLSMVGRRLLESSGAQRAAAPEPPGPRE